jgi:hypothetical protein
MQLKVLAIAVLLAIPSAFPVPSAAGERLTAHELANLFPGRFQAVVTGLISFRIIAAGNGSLSAVSPRGKKDQGRWSVRANQLCIRFENWLGGRMSCTSIVRDADWYVGSKVKFKRV